MAMYALYITRRSPRAVAVDAGRDKVPPPLPSPSCSLGW